MKTRFTELIDEIRRVGSVAIGNVYLQDLDEIVYRHKEKSKITELLFFCNEPMMKLVEEILSDHSGHYDGASTFATISSPLSLIPEKSFYLRGCSFHLFWKPIEHSVIVPYDSVIEPANCFLIELEH